jgi:hypothetical protein
VRSFLAREAARDTVRAAWDEQASGWATDARAGGAGAVAADPFFAAGVGAFLFFYTPSKDASRARLVCQLMSGLAQGEQAAGREGRSPCPHSAH